MTRYAAFKSLNFNFLIVNASLNDNNQNPDVDFLHNNVSPRDTYISPSNFIWDFKDFTKRSFSVLHLLNLLQNYINR